MACQLFSAGTGWRWCRRRPGAARRPAARGRDARSPPPAGAACRTAEVPCGLRAAPRRRGSMVTRRTRVTGGMVLANGEAGGHRCLRVLRPGRRAGRATGRRDRDRAASDGDYRHRRCGCLGAGGQRTGQPGELRPQRGRRRGAQGRSECCGQGRRPGRSFGGYGGSGGWMRAARRAVRMRARCFLLRVSPSPGPARGALAGGRMWCSGVLPVRRRRGFRRGAGSRRPGHQGVPVPAAG